MSIYTAAAAVVLAGWAIALSVVDLRERRLPNALTLTGTVAILLVAVLGGRGIPALLGAAALGAVYLVIHLADPAGLGGGDVKLALGLGALTGALGSDIWILAALGAPALTAAVGTVAAVRHRGRVIPRGLSVCVAHGPPVCLPHGPSMCAASLLAAALAVF